MVVTKFFCQYTGALPARAYFFVYTYHIPVDKSVRLRLKFGILYYINIINDAFFE